MDIHKEEIEKKNWQVEFKDKQKNKSNKKNLETLFTRRRVLMHQSIQLCQPPPPTPTLWADPRA